MRVCDLGVPVDSLCTRGRWAAARFPSLKQSAGAGAAASTRRLFSFLSSETQARYVAAVTLTPSRARTAATGRSRTVEPWGVREAPRTPCRSRFSRASAASNAARPTRSRLTEARWTRIRAVPSAAMSGGSRSAPPLPFATRASLRCGSLRCGSRSSPASRFGRRRDRLDVQRRRAM
jgi:hypothetical protein